MVIRPTRLFIPEIVLNSKIILKKNSRKKSQKNRIGVIYEEYLPSLNILLYFAKPPLPCGIYKEIIETPLPRAPASFVTRFFALKMSYPESKLPCTVPCRVAGGSFAKCPSLHS
jgi:hypothetical protein